MSHFSPRGGYDLTSERANFLNERCRAEQRAREVALSPRSAAAFNFRALHARPGIAPGFRNPAATYLRPLSHLPAAALAAAPAPESPRHSIQAPPPPEPPSPRPLEELRHPSVSTSTQVAYAPHDPEFLARFRTGSEHGKMHDSTTEFREKVFGMWNVTNQKRPASFR